MSTIYSLFNTTERRFSNNRFQLTSTNIDEDFSIKLRKGSLIPEEITVNESSTTTTIRFSEATFDTMMPSFVISKPGAFVNDLR